MFKDVNSVQSLLFIDGTSPVSNWFYDWWLEGFSRNIQGEYIPIWTKIDATSTAED